MITNRRIRSVAATGVFLLLVAATFFTYWQKTSERSALGNHVVSYGAAHSGSDEMQRWAARILPAPAGDETQRWEARYSNVAR